MKIGLWNIDHPENESGSKRKQQRFDDVTDFLISADCDAYIITEANHALDLTGYFREFSQESPYTSKNRFYGSTNSYHQVALYSKNPIKRGDISEPINSLLADLNFDDTQLHVYGNVVTIKDRWLKESHLKYRDRLEQQIESIKQLPKKRVLIAGDFNLRLGWTQKKGAYNRLKEIVESQNLIWVTATRDDTVQHVLHTKDIKVDVNLDFSVKRGDKHYRGLSDHPFIEMLIKPK